MDQVLSLRIKGSFLEFIRKLPFYFDVLRSVSKPVILAVYLVDLKWKM